jgi:hypothetical protein
MSDAVMLERIVARRVELEEQEERLVKQLAEVRVERDELGCLPRLQRDGAADDDQVVAAVQAGDHHVGPGDRAEDAADDHLPGVAVLHLSSGSLRASRTVVLRVLISTCATPMSGSGAAWVDGKQAPEWDLALCRIAA